MNVSKKLIAFAGLLSLLLVFAYWIYPRETTTEYEAVSEYIFDKSHNITLDEVKKARQPIPLKTKEQDDVNLTGGSAEPDQIPDIDIRQIFAEALINSYTTVNYFKHLEHRFKESVNLGDHLEQVRQHLFSEFSASEATQLYETYQKYIECEIALSGQFREFGLVKTPEDAIEILHRIQEFRRLNLGDELADQLFGANVKAQEYAFRRAVVVGDSDLYGPEKEALLRKLNDDMWGEEADAVEAHPNEYTRYQEKLRIYDKDLSEITIDKDRQDKIREFRKQFFTPEAVERLEAVDLQIAREQKQENLYRKKEAMVLNDPDLAERDREVHLRELQEELFGEDAEAFRRGETMRIEREKLMKEYEGKGIQGR